MKIHALLILPKFTRIPDLLQEKILKEGKEPIRHDKGLKEFEKSLDLEHLYEKLLYEGFDFDALLVCKKEDLAEIKLKPGERTKLLRNINKTNYKVSDSVDQPLGKGSNMKKIAIPSSKPIDVETANPESSKQMSKELVESEPGKPPQRISVSLDPQLGEDNQILEGIYKLGSSLINDHLYWTNVNGLLALWYTHRENSDVSFWMFGTLEYLGKNQGFLKGPENKDSLPMTIQNGYSMK